MSKRIFYIIFFTLLVLGFFATLANVIPGFVKTKMPPISKVAPFSMTNQDGKPFTNEDVKGKVSVVNFFFTTCLSVCPRMNNNLKPVYEAYRNDSGFMMLSFTCYPARDSAAQLRHYADSMKVDTRKWVFLTGRKDSLYRLARNSYAIDDPKNFVQNPDDDFMHTQFVALVNRNGEVVHIYDGIKPSEMEQLKKDVQKILKE